MKKHNKLVRDKIPKICQDNNDQPKYRILSQIEFKKKLKKKLLEEAQELVEAKPGQLKNEIVDVYEVLLSLAKAFKIKWSDIERFRKQKNKKRGSFKKKYFLVSTKK